MLSDADVTINSIASGVWMLWLAAWLRGAGRLVSDQLGRSCGMCWMMSSGLLWLPKLR